MFLNALVIDLKKKNTGHPHAEIDSQRLDEATAVLAKLEQCKEHINFK